jgi:hypothetical protein
MKTSSLTKISVTKKNNLLYYILNWLLAVSKIMWEKIVSKGKAFEPLPKDAPH